MGRMKIRFHSIAAIVAAALAAMSATVCLADDDLCVGGVCYLTKEDADAARARLAAEEGKGFSYLALEDDEEDYAAAEETAAAPAAQVLMGMRSEKEFLAFLRGEEAAGALAEGFLALLLVALVCGLADNLTPCVLPLVPVNLAIIGRSAGRGVVYGLGQIAGAGTMGLLAALAGMGFGEVQSSIWFNVAAAAAMVILALATLDVITIDFSRFRKTRANGAGKSKKGLFGVWLLGGASVLLAGACVEPVLLAILLETAEGVGHGNWHFALLPFAFGLGLALPWPFVGAGLGILPKPGVWMVWLKRLLALVVLAFAARYAYLAWHLAHPAEQPVAADAVESGEHDAELWILSAPWCLNCHEMERTVLKAPEVVQEMEKFSIRRVEIDTLDDLQKYPELKDLGIRGLPCYVIRR